MKYGGDKNQCKTVEITHFNFNFKSSYTFLDLRNALMHGYVKEEKNYFTSCCT